MSDHIFRSPGVKNSPDYDRASSAASIACHGLLISVIAFLATGCGQVALPIVTIASHSGVWKNFEPVRKKHGSQERLSSARRQARDFKVKGLYLTGWTVGGADRLKRYVELAEKTEINTYVVDIKDSDGYVGYDSNIEAVRAAQAFQRRYKPEAVTAAFHEKGIRVIGRLTCFKDPVISSKHPEWAIQTQSGKPWKDDSGKTWLNPYKRECWPYLIAIAKEGLQRGFDEIQFDYVRFANDGDKAGMRFGDTKGQDKHEIIKEFLAFARKEMPDDVLSADVFGIICESPADTEGIGQYLEMLGNDVDFISPMVYPSHYAFGQVVNTIRYPVPDREPHGVVYNTLLQAKKRIGAVPDFHAGMRPYLQDFTATWLGKGKYQEYGAQQVRQQIKAVYDAGYDQWILWSAKNKSMEATLEKEPAANATKVASAERPERDETRSAHNQ